MVSGTAVIAARSASSKGFPGMAMQSPTWCTVPHHRPPRHPMQRGWRSSMPCTRRS